jgi:DnaJ-class molecular chaperone
MESSRIAIPCAFCGGKGTDPFNQLSEKSRCESCHGRGVVLVPRHHVRCGYCNGAGSYKTYRCPTCGGTGVTEPVRSPVQTCPHCDGLGFETGSGLECLTCRGRKAVPA